MFNNQNKQVNPKTIPFSPQTKAKTFSGFYPSVKIQAVGSTTLQCMFIKVRLSQKSKKYHRKYKYHRKVQISQKICAKGNVNIP